MGMPPTMPCGMNQSAELIQCREERLGVVQFREKVQQIMGLALPARRRQGAIVPRNLGGPLIKVGILPSLQAAAWPSDLGGRLGGMA